MSKEIIIHGRATAEAEGTHRTKGCKAVFCLETGEIFASGLDAANAKGVCPDMISRACTGKVRSCKGQHFFFVSKATENLNLVAMHLRSLATEMAELKTKAALYDAWQAELEAERKAEEERKQRLLFQKNLLDEITNRRAEREAKLAELAEADKADVELFLRAEAEIKALQEALSA